MQGILIDATLDFGAVSTVEVDGSKWWASISDYLGCKAPERVELAEGLDMWVDSEGGAEEVNPVAAALAAAMGVDGRDYPGKGKALLLAHRGASGVGGLSDAIRDDLLDDLSAIRELLG